MVHGNMFNATVRSHVLTPKFMLNTKTEMQKHCKAYKYIKTIMLNKHGFVNRSLLLTLTINKR